MNSSQSSSPAPRGPLNGKAAVVTGASQGIGLAIATALAGSGMRVWMVARNHGRLTQAAESIGGDVVPFQADLTDPQARGQLVSAITGAGQGLHVLVNNAGTFRRGRMEESAEDDLVEQLTANVVAPYAVTRAFLPLLREAEGDIIFINSSAGRIAKPGEGLYSAGKHAAHALAESLRSEINRDGVRVTTIYPGRTATPLQQAIYAEEGRPYDPTRLIQPSDIAHIITAVLMLPRTAEVTEIAVRSMRKP